MAPNILEINWKYRAWQTLTPGKYQSPSKSQVYLTFKIIKNTKKNLKSLFN